VSRFSSGVSSCECYNCESSNTARSPDFCPLSHQGGTAHCCNITRRGLQLQSLPRAQSDAQISCPEGSRGYAREAGEVVGVSQLTVRLDDEELEVFLEDQANKSEVVRQALRREMYQQESVDDPRLTDEQRQAYEWLRRYAGVWESVSAEVTMTELAQQLSRKKESVKLTVLQPLERHGYIEPRFGTVIVRPPVRPTDGEAGREYDDPSTAASRIDELTAAETAAD